ncbi:MAG: hypothetical protein HYZ00_12025 [Candidatus Hydrogenedentes bacterium]|nr:hypothetical protein [Candidatus Hydrogenedentota bacterium]
MTFYKPAKRNVREVKRITGNEVNPPEILSEVFDECLKNGVRSFTSEALFNRLVIELWHRNALRCLSLDRKEFANHLERRGWSYNPRTHLWSEHHGSVDCML